MKFLVATDGSAESEKALDHAISLAKAAGASITVVHAVSPAVYEIGDQPVTSLSEAERSLIMEGITEAEKRGEEIVEDAAEAAEERGLTVDTDLLYGEPVDAVVTYAEDGDYDGIFVGHRGRSEEVEGFVGSVAKKLVERSPVPVTVVR